MPTVMITGTNRGLGFEFVKQYAADGWPPPNVGR
jgi:NAD(P)-dependent dehydrogenase (short-subunit alcohol dehydrogenase family)